jgi:iron complex outermembrane recepter protein
MNARSCLIRPAMLVSAIAWASVGSAWAQATVDSGSATQSATSNELSEIVVTAEKREERLLDVPIPLTAVNAEALTELNETKFSDFYASIPNLSFAPQGASQQLLAIRGITTGGGQATVGIMIDDAPFTSPTGEYVPDLDPGDLERIEVLRGPQGTLYGAATLGGLIKFVTKQPTMDEFSGRVEVGSDVAYNGPNAGYTVRGSVNVPVSDTFAVRASAFARQDPGYIDDIYLHLRGTNMDRAEGGHLAALWTPTDSLTVKLSALAQAIHTFGAAEEGSEFGNPVGDLQNDFYRDPNGRDALGGGNRRAEAYSATITDKIGKATITSVSSYNLYKTYDDADESYYYGGAAQPFGVTGGPLINYQNTSKLSEELRLTAPLGPRIDLLAGLFYTHENDSLAQTIAATNSYTGYIAGTIYTGDQPVLNTEFAGFTDLTFHFTDAFSTQVGARMSDIHQTQYTQIYTGEFFYPTYYQRDPPIYASNHPFTYLFSPQYKVSSNLMVYARLSSGYREGGGNSAVAPGSPVQFAPDKTYDYDLGIKGELWDGRFSYDAALYYIDWRNIQLILSVAGFAYNGNAGGAKSQGLEFNFDSHPFDRIRVAGWVVFSEAELTSYPQSADLGGAYAVPGTTLPLASRFSTNLTLDYELPVAEQLKGFAGLGGTYLGQRWGGFSDCANAACTIPLPREELPAYAKFDLHAGLTYGTWKTTAYATNVLDRRGQLLAELPPTVFSFIPPRVLGITVEKRF